MLRAKQRYRRGILLLVTGLAIAGCAVDRAHTIPFDGSDNKGVVYSVPKTYLSVTLQYVYTRDEVRPGMPEAHLEGAVRIAPLLVPDEKSTFIIKTDGLMKNAMFLTNVEFRFANGTLESVDATVSDRTGEVIQEMGVMAANIAKAAAKGEATPREKAIAAAERHIDDLYTAIAKTAAEPVGGEHAGPGLEALQRELEAARRLVLDLRANVDPPMRSITAPLTLLVDPDRPTRVTDEYLEYEVRPPQLFPDVPEDNMDVLLIRIYDDQRRVYTEALHDARRPKDAEGIIYRQPVPLMTKIIAGSDPDEQVEVFSGMLPYSQFAPPSVAALESKLLTSKHTGLVLDTVNGGLVSYGHSQDSALVEVASAGAVVSGAAVKSSTTKPSASGRGASSSGSKSGASGTTSGGTATKPATQPTSPPATQQATTRGGRGGAITTTRPALP